MKLTILSILITIITLFTVSYSSHLEQLMYDKLPSDDKFLINYNSLMFIEPMIEDWSPEWNYDIEQNKVRNELQSIYSITKQYCQSDSLNLELNLLMGLISHYAYNLDLVEYGDSVEYYLTKAKTLTSDDIRPNWFYALHLSKSALLEQGMNMFINLIQSNKITNGCFWEDYAYVAYFCQMFLHTVSALDSAKKYLQKESRYEEIFGRKLRNKFHYPDVNDTLDVKNLWSIIHEDSMATFISIPLGYKISIPIHWKILPLSYFNRIAGLNFKLSPYMGYMGEITTNISIITHVPAKDESLDDYMKKFLKTTFSFEQVDLQLSLNEKSYIGINQYLYEDEGGAKVIVLGFERSEPVNRLSILEKPQSLNPSTNGFSAYRLNRDTLYYRFPGKLQYVILLDCCNSIFTMVFEDFKAALKTFVVE